MCLTTDKKQSQPDTDRKFLERVKGNIIHVNDPKVQRTVREIDDRLRRRRREEAQ